MDQLIQTIAAYSGLILAGVSSAYAWWSQRNAAAQSEIDRLEKANTEVEKRVAKLEFELSHLPSKDLVNDLKLTMSDLHGQLAAMAERLNAVGNTVSIIDRTLRDQK